MAKNGVSSKFNPPRAGILCIGCMGPPCNRGELAREIIKEGKTAMLL
jgi:hypothetical protein